MWQLESQIRYIQAQIAGNSGTIAKICNADVADLGFKMCFHELIEVPLSRTIGWQVLPFIRFIYPSTHLHNG